MAVNKRRILETAQKFLQKGALDKALKEYRSLLELDPRDSSSRLKLGDIHLRLGEKDEAVAAYLKVAQQFMKEGFDAKAVALFKQIAKLAPEQVEIHVPLAELYQRLGLPAEAMAALQTATEGFQKAGRKREAFELLRKAAALDPTNTTSRIKIADLLRHQGMTAEALNEYDEVAAELERSGETEVLASVYERVLEIEPDRLSTLLALARLSLTAGACERAHELAERAAAARPDLIEALELHAEALQALGRDAEETDSVLRRLAELHRAHGNEGRAREILQQLLPECDLTLNGVDDFDTTVSGEGFPSSDLCDDLTQAGARLGPLPPPVPLVPLEPVVEADLEQLLAEAGVYLRFGKREKAIASLETVLAQMPEHADALEKLAGALSHDGEGARAARLFARAAGSARARGDEAAAVSFDARAAELDSALVQSIGSTGETPSDGLKEAVVELDDRASLLETNPAAPAPAEPGPQAQETALALQPEFEFEVELDLSAGDDLDASVELASHEPAPVVGPPGALGSEIELCQDEELSVELELGAPMQSMAEEQAPMALGAETEIPTEDELAASFRAGLEEPAEVDELEKRPELPDLSEFIDLSEPASLEPPLAFEPACEQTPPLLASPTKILEDLEEADFYFRQGLLEEAECVYRRVLEVANTNPQALLRLGEIAAARGGDPGAERHVEAPEPERAAQPEVPWPDGGDAHLGDDLADWDDAVQGGEQTAATSFEVALEDDAALAGEPEVAAEATPNLEDQTAQSLADEPAPDSSARGEVEERDESEPTREVSHFDLAAELSDALGIEETAASIPTQEPPEAEESLEAIFSEFKRGVHKTLTAADHETHYDLGIAYREMGLLEDAVGEFKIALESPTRRLDCLHLLGLCARDLKTPQDAIAFFRQALAEQDLEEARRAALGFDLGIALEEAGDSAAALSALEEVAALEPGFPGLEERIDTLRALLALAPAEIVGERAEAPVEVYESFDDVIAQAEADLVSGPSEARPAAPQAPEQEAPGPATKPTGDDLPPKPPRGTSPRRRKISFG